MFDFKYVIGPDTRIFFPDKPSEAIRSLLKGAGFRWSPSAGCWWRRGIKGAADFITALDKRLNPRPDGACWKCKSPEGYFRPRGAATPVYCAACDAADRAANPPISQYIDRSDLDYEDDCRAACGL